MADKKFKDTGLGRFLTEKIPDAIGIIGDVLPDQGVFGIAKNIIEGSTLSPQDKQIARQLQMEEEQMYLTDRQHARQREVDKAKTGSPDTMMWITGGIVLVLLVLTVIAVLFFEIKNPEIAHLIVGEIIGLASGIIFYYYGTSKSSNDKTKLLDRLKP